MDPEFKKWLDQEIKTVAGTLSPRHEEHTAESIIRHKELVIVATAFYDLMEKIKNSDRTNMVDTLIDFAKNHKESTETRMRFWKEMRESVPKD